MPNIPLQDFIQKCIKLKAPVFELVPTYYPDGVPIITPRITEEEFFGRMDDPNPSPTYELSKILVSDHINGFHLIRVPETKPRYVLAMVCPLHHRDSSKYIWNLHIYEYRKDILKAIDGALDEHLTTGTIQTLHNLCRSLRRAVWTFEHGAPSAEACRVKTPLAKIRSLKPMRAPNGDAILAPYGDVVMTIGPAILANGRKVLEGSYLVPSVRAAHEAKARKHVRKRIDDDYQARIRAARDLLCDEANTELRKALETGDQARASALCPTGWVVNLTGYGQGKIGTPEGSLSIRGALKRGTNINEGTAT
jgi:hypothetical protein